MHGWSCDKIPSLLLFTATHDGVEVSLCQALIHHGLRLTTDINNIDYHHQCLYHTCVWYWKEQSIPLVPSNFAWPLSIVLFPTKKGSFTHSGVDQIDWPRFQPLKCCALHPPSSNLWPSWSVHYPLQELVPHLCLGSNERFSIFFQHLWEFCFEILRKEKELPWDSLRIAHFPWEHRISSTPSAKSHFCKWPVTLLRMAICSISLHPESQQILTSQPNKKDISLENSIT